MTSIVDIEGVGEQYAEKLKAIGIASVEALLDKGATAKGRAEITSKSGIGAKLILRWVNHADLFRIKGVAGQYSELLEASGVDTVVELSKRKPENLYEAIDTVIGKLDRQVIKYKSKMQDHHVEKRKLMEAAVEM